MSGSPDVVVIGAGPYGLSIAAHLRARGVDHRVFGRPMEFWERHTPKGMLLKSDAYASNLSCPQPPFTLKDFCLERGVPYADEGIPISCATFVEYGQAFQRRHVPHLEETEVVAVGQTATGYLVRLASGEMVATRKIVVAVGIGPFAQVPAVLAGLSPDLASHSSVHHDLSRFRGREVCVVGGGASAVCNAALLHEAGASVHMAARQLRFHDRTPLEGRSLLERVRAPHSGVGSGWRSAIFANAPTAFRALPERLRVRAVRNSNGPAGGWAMKDRVLGRFPILEGHSLAGAQERGGRVHLDLAAPGGTVRQLTVDHVVAATGYSIELGRLPFLEDTLAKQIRCVESTPVLSSSFEASVPGLYFVGPIAKNAFGPLMRFVYGAHFASARTTRHVARSTVRRFVRGHAAADAR